MTQDNQPDQKPDRRAEKLKDKGITNQLDALDTKISTAKEKHNPKPKQGALSDSAGIGMGFRMAVEMMAAVFVGVFLGYQLDKWLDSSPLFLLLLFFLGIVTGFWNIIKTAQKFEQRQAEQNKKNDTEIK
ncbi:MAG: AtpZ/AtpI family protein [Alphaproteobacteria bacterium]|nr:AtpZ/AtpI family protein [Alphaproteobacteria bacterium]